MPTRRRGRSRRASRPAPSLVSPCVNGALEPIEQRRETRAEPARPGPCTDGRPDLRYDLRAEPQRDLRPEPDLVPARPERMLPPAAARPAAPQTRPAPQDGYGEPLVARPQQPAPQPPRRPAAPPQNFAPAPQAAPAYAPHPPQAAPAYAPPQAPRTAAYPGQEPAPQQRAPAPQARGAENATQLQQSIARIHEVRQAPPLSPPEYRVLFEVMAEEINANNLSGAQTLVNTAQRALEMGLEVKRDDIRFVLEVVSEADPRFEQGASPNLFASRFLQLYRGALPRTGSCALRR